MTTRTFAAIICLAIGVQQAPPPPPPSPLAAAAAAAAAARRGVPASAQSGAPVSLTFAWPAGMTATIEADFSKTVVMDGKTRQTGGGIRYRMRVAAHPEGRLISYEGFEPLGAPVPAAAAPAIEEYLTSLMPSIVVAAGGQFLRVADLTKIRAVVSAFLEKLKERTPPAAIPANVQQMLDGLTSETVLTQIAAGEWQHFVGAFAGFTGKIGEADEFDSEEPSPVMAGVKIPMRTAFRAARLLPCEAGRAPDSCVEMQVRSTVAPGAMQALAKRMFEGAKDMEGVTYERFDVLTEILAIMEPSTMKPYRVTLTKRIEFTGSMPGEAKSSVSQTQTRAYRITYAK